MNKNPEEEFNKILIAMLLSLHKKHNRQLQINQTIEIIDGVAHYRSSLISVRKKAKVIPLRLKVVK